MRNWKEGLDLVFSKAKYNWLFIALCAVLLPLYGVLTDIIILQPLSVNPNLKPLEAALIGLVGVLAALGFTIAAFQLSEMHSVKRSAGGSVLGAGMGGTAIATFASACTVCQPIWLIWLGFGSATAFLADYSLYILVASLAVLLYSLNSGLAAITKGCGIPKRRKK